jgi:hypothetical protein
VTSNTERVHPFHALLPADQTGLQRDSKAQAEQVRSVSAERVGRTLGQLPAKLVAELDRALRVHLGLLQPGRARENPRVAEDLVVVQLSGSATIDGQPAWVLDQSGSGGISCHDLAEQAQPAAAQERGARGQRGRRARHPGQPIAQAREGRRQANLAPPFRDSPAESCRMLAVGVDQQVRHTPRSKQGAKK